MAASPWKTSGGRWHLEDPAGPIRLEGPPGRREARLSLRRGPPPAFRLRLSVIFEAWDQGRTAEATIYVHGSRTDGFGIRLDPGSGEIRAIAPPHGRDALLDEPRREAAEAPGAVRFEFHAGEPIRVEIEWRASAIEGRLAASVRRDGAAAVGAASVEGTVRLAAGAGPLSSRGVLALAGRGCTALFDKIAVTPLPI